MNLENSNWKFDSSVVPIFDEHVKKSVPLYDEIHSLIKDISGWYLKDNTKMYDIGASTGKLIKNLLKTYNKNINYIAIDNSIEMVNKLNTENNSIEVLNIDVTDNFNFENASLITSVLTIQFIDQGKRQDLIKNIYKGLNKGGAFIFVEKIIGNNARFNEMYIELYHELKLKNGLTADHVFDKARSIRGVMKPYTLEENMELLQNAGFKDVDIFFKWNNFIGFIAVK